MNIIQRMAAMWVAYVYEEASGRRRAMVVGKEFEKPHFRGQSEYGRTRCGRYWEKEWPLLDVEPQWMCADCVKAILAQYEVVAE